MANPPTPELPTRREDADFLAYLARAGANGREVCQRLDEISQRLLDSSPSGGGTPSAQKALQDAFQDGAEFDFSTAISPVTARIAAREAEAKRRYPIAAVPSASEPPSAEQEARDMLERMGIANAQQFTSGDLVELANLIASRSTGTPSVSEEDVQRAIQVAGETGSTRAVLEDFVSRHTPAGRGAAVTCTLCGLDNENVNDVRRHCVFCGALIWQAGGPANARMIASRSAESAAPTDDIPPCDEDSHYWVGATETLAVGTPCRCGEKGWRAGRIGAKMTLRSGTAEWDDFAAEMAKQAELGHTCFCIGVHDGGFSEWISWPKAFARLAQLNASPTDTERLDWLDASNWNAAALRPVGASWEVVDKRGGSLAIRPDIRTAIDAAMSSRDATPGAATHG